MSPPTVNLATKPSDSTKDVEINAPAPTRSKNYRAVAGALIIATAVIAGAVIGGIALHHHIWNKKEYTAKAVVDDRILYESIHVDYEKEVILVSNPAEGEINGLDALHDYGKKILAFKDTTVNRCFIDVLDQTFVEGLDQWKDFSTYNRVPPKREMIFIHEPIDKLVIKAFLGKYVAEHCADVPAHWIVAPPEGALKTAPMKFKNHSVTFVCRPHIVINCNERHPDWPRCRFLTKRPVKFALP